MEISTPQNRIADIFMEAVNVWIATVTIDENYAQVFKLDHEPTGDECDSLALEHIVLKEQLLIQRLEEERLQGQQNEEVI